MLVAVLQNMLGPLCASVSFDDVVKGRKSATAHLLKKRYVVLDSGTGRLVVDDLLVNKLAMGTVLNSTVEGAFRPAPMPIALSRQSPTVACMDEDTQSRYCPWLLCITLSSVLRDHGGILAWGEPTMLSDIRCMMVQGQSIQGHWLVLAYCCRPGLLSSQAFIMASPDCDTVS